MEWGVEGGRRGNVLRITPAGWTHILEGHVDATFNPATRTGKPVSTVFKGTPAQYAALLEEAVRNRAVVTKMTEAVKNGLRDVEIPVVARGQTMVSKVDVATGNIKTFHVRGRIVNPALFEVR